jgi:hypothetical protein
MFQKKKLEVQLDAQNEQTLVFRQKLLLEAERVKSQAVENKLADIQVQFVAERARTKKLREELDAQKEQTLAWKQ